MCYESRGLKPAFCWTSVLDNILGSWFKCVSPFAKLSSKCKVESLYRCVDFQSINSNSAWGIWSTLHSSVFPNTNFNWVEPLQEKNFLPCIRALMDKFWQIWLQQKEFLPLCYRFMAVVRLILNVFLVFFVPGSVRTEWMACQCCCRTGKSLSLLAQPDWSAIKVSC